MKTTLNIDDQLFRTAKKMAAERGVTLTKVIEEALRAAVTERRVHRGRFRLQWVTVKGRSKPDVDIADRAALYDWMEGRS